MRFTSYTFYECIGARKTIIMISWRKTLYRALCFWSTLYYVFTLSWKINIFWWNAHEMNVIRHQLVTFSEIIQRFNIKILYKWLWLKNQNIHQNLMGKSSGWGTRPPLQCSVVFTVWGSLIYYEWGHGSAKLFNRPTEIQT